MFAKKNGIILITTRSKGFPYHAYPNDFWRYEIGDMKKIFADCEIMKLEKDPEVPGVFVKTKKPTDFQENNLSQQKLFSIIYNDYVLDIDEDCISYKIYLFKLALRKKVKNFLGCFYKFFFKSF